MNDDRYYLKQAIKAACDGILEGGGPFGAVIVRDGKIIAKAGNRVVLSHDPTAHAEVLAIREASGMLDSHDLSDCVLYASCEPCPMCLGAIYWSGLRRVVFASGRSEASSAGFNDNFIYSEIGLDPSERKIDFIQIHDAGGEEAFRIWEQYEDKIPY